MRNLLVVIAVLLLPLCLLAQDLPKGQVFGGYSYMRSSGQGLNGFDAQFTYNSNKMLGLTADVSGEFGGQSVSIPGVGASASSSGHLYNFLFGPTVSHRTDSKLVPFAHGLLGIARTGGSASMSIFGQSLNLSSGDTGFGMALGGGLDYEINKAFAIRPVQMDYVLTRAGGGSANSFRYAAGVVFRLGK
jgi:outer membrane immunogenic protein